MRITFGVAAPVPFRCEKTEAALKGQEISEKLYEMTEQSIRQEINKTIWRHPGSSVCRSAEKSQKER